MRRVRAHSDETAVVGDPTARFLYSLTPNLPATILRMQNHRNAILWGTPFAVALSNAVAWLCLQSRLWWFDEILLLLAVAVGFLVGAQIADYCADR